MDSNSIKTQLRSENSAQSEVGPPNPFVVKAISYIRRLGGWNRAVRSQKIADQGCGRLRHLKIFRQYFKHIALIDTELQLSRIRDSHRSLGSTSRRVSRKTCDGICLFNSESFAQSRLHLDAIFCACVFDVVPPTIRSRIIAAAARNLKKNGFYCVVIPRNDQSITVRCSSRNRYKDGHVFPRGRTFTFYANFANGSPSLGKLRRQLTEAGFRKAADLSVRRQVCLILQKSMTAEHRHQKS